MGPRRPRLEEHERKMAADSGATTLQVYEPAAYWLLYVVALAAGWVHWRCGNYLLAALCALAVLLSVRLITRPS